MPPPSTTIHNDLALLRVGSLDGTPPCLRPTESGTPGAVLGYPENGSFTIGPARLGATGTVVSQDAYGRGPSHAR